MPSHSSEHVTDIDHDVAKRRARFLLTKWMLFLIVGITSAIVIALMAANSIIALQSRGQLYDCVTPGGKCFDDGQRRSEERIQRIIKRNGLDEVATRRIVIVATACSKLPGVNTVAEVQKCVDTQLALDEDKH